MANDKMNYNYIQIKIHQMKESEPWLRDKSDDYVFSALTAKSIFYKNPSLTFPMESIVDGTNDGGVDVLLTDPNSDTSDLVLIQSKYYQKISYEDVTNAVTKLVRFYNNMINGDYECIHQNVIKRFLNLNAEVGDESKVIFVFFTSAEKNGIRKDRVQKAFKALIPNNDKFELRLYYADEIVEEIKEADSRRPTVELGKLHIDYANNYLEYGEDAVIVNVSAFCLKELYGINGLNLLARNLRYHVAGSAVDRAIKDSIKNTPEEFWFKNNGVTIICDEFEISGKVVKLRNFSIVNGGQTTYNIFKSKELNKEMDFYLPCKIITVKGDDEDEKNRFSLEIAKATNSQKAIKPVDLKANSPEQVRFANAMRSVGIFYQTKRGEVIPKEYKEAYLNTDLADTGKLCLAAIFQMPASSRNKPSMMYNTEYYEDIFNSDQDKVSRLVKDLLYVDFYFRKSFLKKFDAANESNPNATELIPFAHNARTTCIAFVAFAARVKAGNITSENLATLFNNIREGSYAMYLYDIFRNIDNVDSFIPKDLFNDKDKLDDFLYKLFDIIIKSGRKCYSSDKKYDTSLNASNYLKKDNNYYTILKEEWDSIEEKINSIFEQYQ